MHHYYQTYVVVDFYDRQCHSNSVMVYYLKIWSFEMLRSSFIMSFWKINILLLFRPSASEVFGLFHTVCLLDSPEYHF